MYYGDHKHEGGTSLCEQPVGVSVTDKWSFFSSLSSSKKVNYMNFLPAAAQKLFQYVDTCSYLTDCGTFGTG